MSVRRIAQATGFSPATVSLALNNHPRITTATKARVQAAAKAMGYTPNAKLVEFMHQLRRSDTLRTTACLGMIHLYEEQHPWRRSPNLRYIVQAMQHQAEALGYRIEPFWLRGPGMTARRLGTILDARGIEGLICLGSPEVDSVLPSALDHYAVVAQGVSIQTPMHRVTSHFYDDMVKTMDELYKRGYRRPALLVQSGTDERTDYAYSSAFAGSCHRLFGKSSPPLIWDVGELDAARFFPWLDANQPDALVINHTEHFVLSLHQAMLAQGWRIPRDIGFACVGVNFQRPKLSGIRQNMSLVGAWCVELLISRIHQRDFGIPAHPKIEMVKGLWVEGETLRRRR